MVLIDLIINKFSDSLAGQSIHERILYNIIYI